MKGKNSKKTIIVLITIVVLALSALIGLLIWKHSQRMSDGNIVQTEETDEAPLLVLDYNNVSLGLDKSFTVQAKTYWKGKEVKDEVTYTWELEADCSQDVASIETSKDSATITGVAYGETAYKVSAEYKGVLMVRRLSVYVSNIDVIFDSPNMELSAGCYTVNLGLIETDTDITSLIPEIYVYEKEELVENPEFTWTNSDVTIAVMDEDGKIIAKKAGTTLIIGKYKESEIHIRVNVYRSRIEKSPVYIEALKNYQLRLSYLDQMTVEDVIFNETSVLKSYHDGSETITFDTDQLPDIGTSGKLIVQTDKAEFVMDALVVTMAIHNETDLNKMASVIASNKGEGYYALANDIHCMGVYDANLDVEFIGTFDGRSHTIYNMTTSDRDAGNRGLLGATLGQTGVVKNVAFVNAKHSGNGGFIATQSGGAIKNVYIQIDVEHSAATDTSILSVWTYGVYTTENVLIEYITPLPADAVSGYAVGHFNYGYAKHQGLYVIGAADVAGEATDLGGGLKDVYGAYLTYGNFVDANVDLKAWENDFWTLQNGIPYPTHLGKRAGVTPNVSIPAYVSPGTTINIQGATICDRITLSSALKKLGIKVSGTQLVIPEKVPAGTKITLQVSSAFDTSRKTTIQTTVLTTEKITVAEISNAETYQQTTFVIDLSAYASKLQGAELFYVAIDGQSFEKMLYKDGILTLDTGSLGSLGRKTTEITFKKGDKLIAFTVPTDVCTVAIYDETDFHNMASVIEENEGMGRYVLADDIVCTNSYDANISVEFNGTFDGHGYVIYDMTTSDREGANRGLVGGLMGRTGVVENVAFVNAQHGGQGGFITSNSNGTVKNVYIQIDITDYNAEAYDGATSILTSSAYSFFSTENVLIEYINPLPKEASNGYAAWQLYYGYSFHKGLYVVGADSVYRKLDDLGGGLTDTYAAYTGFAEFIDAKVDFSAWENDFWNVTGKIPYPKRLGSREGTVPEVSIPKYLGAGTSVVIDGYGMYDKAVLGSDMKALGITVKEGVLNIPASVPRGTVVRVAVESVFDSSKGIVLQGTVYENVNVTIDQIYDVATYNNTTFDIDFGTYASEVGNGTLVSATVGSTNFSKATYQDGILTLDTSTLSNYGKQTVTAVYDRDSKLVTVTLTIDVSTMVISSEADLNNMASVIEANDGAGRYVLGQDIICQGTYDANISVEFNGTFDGRGYAIYNMTTSDREGWNRGLLGAYLGRTGVVENVSFVNAKHGGRGGFIVSEGNGTVKNVYIQIDITDYNAEAYVDATSILTSSAFSFFSTENVLIEYINPLPEGASNGYATWQLYYGYSFHKGLYVIGADSVYQKLDDLGGGLADTYAAYDNYGDFVAAENDLSNWVNDFWTVTNGIPYPTHLGTREGVMPTVTIPEVIAPGSDVVIEGATLCDRVILSAQAKELGITVSNHVLSIPDTVPAGTTVQLIVQSAFDETKQVTLSAEILTSEYVDIEEVTTVELMNENFRIDLTALEAQIGEATLVSVAVDGKSFINTSYVNGVLTLDTITLSGFGSKTIGATLKGEGSLVSVTIPIDVCTMLIENEADLNNMASVITENNGKGLYILGNDIECTGTYDANISVEFNGTFDGRGYAIYNMTTSDRDGWNRGLLGAYLGRTGVVENVSFVNAKHGGRGGFIVSEGNGTIKNVYIQIDITDYNAESYVDATSVLTSSAYSFFSTENVLIEYINPLPKEATNGYATWQLYYGYAFHKGLYAIGADSVYTKLDNLGGGLTDTYAAYVNYDGFVAAGNDLSAWANDFWTVTDGIPYPTHLGERVAVVPTVTIPEIITPGSNVVVEGARVYERIVLDADAQALGITVEGNVISIPDTVELGTEVHLTVESIFDTSKSTTLTTTVNVPQEEEELKKITWTDFTNGGVAVTDGQEFTEKTLISYASGSNLNNTSFEGDVKLPESGSFRYATPWSDFGLTFKESDGKLLISGDGSNIVTVNGKSGAFDDCPFILSASDYRLNSFANTRFTIRIDFYNLADDNLSATVDIYINGEEVATGVQLQGKTIAWTTELGNGVGLDAGVTVYSTKQTLTPITWKDFTKDGVAVTDGQAFTEKTLISYAIGSNLNNTSFEGDVKLPESGSFRYATPWSDFGLTFKESDGKLLISGDGSNIVTVNGKSGAFDDCPFILSASDYELNSFANTRFTIRIDFYNLADDNLSATVDIYINGEEVATGVQLQGKTIAWTTELGNGVGLDAGVTVYSIKPTLTPITWTDFTNGGVAVTDGQVFTTDSHIVYAKGLNNTSFEGDVKIPSGSGFRYAVPSSYFGLTFKESDGQLLIAGHPYVKVNGSDGTVYTLNATDYGIDTFTDTRFTIRIDVYDYTEDNLSATLDIYVNGKEVGTAIKLQGCTLAGTTYLGNGIGFANNSEGPAGGTTVYKKEEL